MKSLTLRVRIALVSAGLTAAGAVLIGLTAVGAATGNSPVITAVVIVSLLGFAVSWVLSGRLVDGVARLTAAGRRAVDGDYTVRTGIGGPSDVADASESLNHLDRKSVV